MTRSRTHGSQGIGLATTWPAIDCVRLASMREAVSFASPSEVANPVPHMLRTD